MKKFTRLFAPLLLIVALILPLCVSAVDERADGVGSFNMEAYDGTTTVFTDDLTNTLTATEIPEALLTRNVETEGFVKRIYEMEDEYTLVYRRSDGTNTVMMFSEPVKYRAADGQLKDKSTQTVRVGNRYVTAETDVIVSFPDNIGQSIGLRYENLTVSMKPIGSSPSASTVAKSGAVLNAKDTLAREASVYTYSNIYDTHTDILYTPTFTGVKCDILLRRNTGKSRFDFEVSLNGDFCLEKSEEEKIIYILNDKEEKVAYFNTVMSYDSASKVSFGDMEFLYDEVSGKYIVTLIVDKSFLDDSETVYPVYIDPTINIHTNQTASPTFEYMATYKNGTSHHSSSLSTADLLVGSSHSKIAGRILYKLPDIPYKSLSSVQLIQCVRTTSTLYSMSAYPYTGTPWTASSSYASVANNFDSNYSMPVVYGASYGTNTKYMTIDLTAFYKTGVASSPSYSIEKGIELININGEDELEYTGNESNVLITTSTTTADPSFACFSPYIVFDYTPYTIKIDGGHFAGQNSLEFQYGGITYTYAEGDQMWKLQQYLISALQTKGFVVSSIRSTNQPLVPVTDYNTWAQQEYQARGNAAAGADLLVALHTNAFEGNTSLSRVVVEMNPNADSGTTTLGNALAASVKTTMGISETSQVIPYSHVLITTAIAAGCTRAYIVEHSFHTNPTSAYWLLNDSNLQQLANAEADAIVAFYRDLQ